ncbi:unnamed protein product [Zymoseptoria tritici ST99CH_1A5]|uniref:Zinc finger PHD-type domain-containing protein n=2 Tax=Zymoseptoria tritici TaxID=1047171 RepID=A0A2H1FLP6_ZYMTR|nr:unnamed protein product [Zymoseptoria tritici ST99CH_1E4]SMY19521.1 unnamed protein product [Zymoseptoria tritici ST99CH_1A5]
MICCDGQCQQWFHFACVGLTKTTIPTGDWYCTLCTGPTTVDQDPVDQPSNRDIGDYELIDDERMHGENDDEELDDDDEELDDDDELNNDRDAGAGLIEDLQEELDGLSSRAKQILDQIQPAMPASHTKPSRGSKQCDEWMTHIAMCIFEDSQEKYPADNSPFHDATYLFLSRSYHIRRQLIAKGLTAFSTHAKAAIAAHANGLRTFDTMKPLPSEDELPFDKCWSLYNILGVDTTVQIGAKHQFAPYAGMTAAQAGSKRRRYAHQDWFNKGIEAVLEDRKKEHGKRRALKAYEFLAKDEVQTTFHVLAKWKRLDETSSAEYTLKFLIQLFETVLMILEGTIDTDNPLLNQATRNLITRCRTPDMPRSTSAQKPLNSELSIAQPMHSIRIKKKFLTILRNVITNSASVSPRQLYQEALSHGFKGSDEAVRRYWIKWSEDGSLPEARRHKPGRNRANDDILRDVITNSTSDKATQVLQEALSQGFKGSIGTVYYWWKKWSKDGSLPEARRDKLRSYKAKQATLSA